MRFATTTKHLLSRTQRKGRIAPARHMIVSRRGRQTNLTMRAHLSPSWSRDISHAQEMHARQSNSLSHELELGYGNSSSGVR